MKQNFHARIPTAGGWWLINQKGETDKYIVSFEAVVSARELIRKEASFDMLSEVYSYLSRRELEENE